MREVLVNKYIMNYAIIIPVLNPDEKTTTFIDTLIEAGFKNIVVIDDGSNKESQKYFDEIRTHSECVVLVHEVNKGKGAALKTAFAYLSETRPDIDAAITADGDGQHNINCINICIKASEEDPDHVIFGGRDFTQANIPARSSFGNKLSAVVYRFACGIKLNDTQTGLRIIPKEHFEEFSVLKGDRYEYETQMIMEIARKKIPYKEVPIETIYIDENETSHFNPVKDSVKIYIVVLGNLIKFVISSLICWLIDEGLFYLFLSVLVGTMTHSERTIMAVIAARVISSIVNFTINKNTVFHSKGSVKTTAVKYFTLAVCQLAVSTFLVNVIAVDLLNVDGFLEVLIKCVVDAGLFLISFTIQRKWVFKYTEADEIAEKANHKSGEK